MTRKCVSKFKISNEYNQKKIFLSLNNEVILKTKIHSFGMKKTIIYLYNCY